MSEQRSEGWVCINFRVKKEAGMWFQAEKTVYAKKPCMKKEENEGTEKVGQLGWSEENRGELVHNESKKVESGDNKELGLYFKEDG